MDLNTVFVGIAGSVIGGVILELLKKYLGFKVKAWVIALALLIGFIASPYVTKLLDSDELEIITGKTFDNETIELDGTEFVRCTFFNCKILFSGEKEFKLTSSTLSGNSYIAFEGKASRTMEVLRDFYYLGFQSECGGNTQIRTLSAFNIIASPHKVLIVDEENDTLSVEKLTQKLKLRKNCQ